MRDKSAPQESFPTVSWKEKGRKCRRPSTELLAEQDLAEFDWDETLVADMLVQAAASAGVVPRKAEKLRSHAAKVAHDTTSVSAVDKAIRAAAKSVHLTFKQEIVFAAAMHHEIGKQVVDWEDEEDEQDAKDAAATRDDAASFTPSSESEDSSSESEDDAGVVSLA